MRFKTFLLLENKRSFVKRTYGRKIIASRSFKADKKESEDQTGVKETDDQFLDLTLEMLERDGDPERGKNLVFLAKWYAANAFRGEDADQVQEDLKIFVKGKRRLEKKDLNAYKTWSEFLDVVDSLKSPNKNLSNKELETKLFKDKEAVLFYKNPKIIKLNSEEAACHFGKGTRWCTAGRDNNQFMDYKDNLFVIYLKKGRLQIYFGRTEYLLTNERDEELDGDDMMKLLIDYPGLRKAFNKLAIQHDTSEFKLHRGEKDINHLKADYLHEVGRFSGNMDERHHVRKFLQFIDNKQTAAVQDYLMRNDFFHLIKNPSPDFIKRGITLQGESFVKNLTQPDREKYVPAVLNIFPKLIYYLKKPTEEQQMMVLKLDPELISRIHHPTHNAIQYAQKRLERRIRSSPLPDNWGYED